MTWNPPKNAERSTRWAAMRDLAVRTLEEHSRSAALDVKVAVQEARTLRREDVVEEVRQALLGPLWRAYEAGLREGHARERARLEQVIRDAVAQAVAKIHVEPARCPHCTNGIGCPECGETGRYPKK